MYVLEGSACRRNINATSQRQKGKEMEKENKTVQEKKVQRMVNDLIKMAEEEVPLIMEAGLKMKGSMLQVIILVV